MSRLLVSGRPPKSNAEKMDDEAERLVRPSTKVLPHRRDKQRNQVELDKATESEKEKRSAGMKQNKIASELRRIASELKVADSPLQKKFQEYFKDKLKEHGVESPADLDDEGKKKLFNSISEDWTKGVGPKE